VIKYSLFGPFWQLVRELLKGINTGDICKAVMTEKKFAKSEYYKINENISTLRISDMVVCLGCSLSY